MKSLAGWFYANKLSLNIYKKKILGIFSKDMENVMTAIKLGNQQILQVRNTKFLGIYIDDGGLEWGDHINHIPKKIANEADVLQAVKRYVSLDNQYYGDQHLNTDCIKSNYCRRKPYVIIIILYIMHRQLRYLNSWVLLN